MARRRRGGDAGATALLQLQRQALLLQRGWLETTLGAAAVVARRTAMLGAALAQPARLADPEFALMATEKMAAVGEAAERASRHALTRRRRRRSPAAELVASLDLAGGCLAPFRRRVRANVKRLS